MERKIDAVPLYALGASSGAILGFVFGLLTQGNLGVEAFGGAVIADLAVAGARSLIARRRRKI